jgi:adenosylhomocysteine nucleosidase
VTSDPRLPILVVTGLAREARIAAGPSTVVIRSGGCPERLRSALGGRLPACGAVVSFGLAGGLRPGLPPGAVVLAAGVVASGERWPADPNIAQAWTRALAAAGQHITLADVAGTETPLLTPAEKAAWWQSTAAAVVDMESHIAAAFAARLGIPFAAIRVVCDPAERALPPLVSGALRPDGGIAVSKILGRLARQPAQVAALPRLAADAAAAFASLGHCRSLLGPRLGLLSFGELLGDVP